MQVHKNKTSSQKGHQTSNFRIGHKQKKIIMYQAVEVTFVSLKAELKVLIL
uniref:Uncharacterized protein n=1 Tax=Arundo donax TaxID=35708 RepID=A0A0A9A1T9_ARUDO